MINVPNVNNTRRLRGVIEVFGIFSGMADGKLLNAKKCVRIEIETRPIKLFDEMKPLMNEMFCCRYRHQGNHGLLEKSKYDENVGKLCAN